MELVWPKQQRVLAVSSFWTESPSYMLSTPPYLPNWALVSLRWIINLLFPFSGCHGNISEAFGSNEKMMTFLDTFSSNVYSQMKLNPKGTEDVDKFSEQGFVCASLSVIECISVHQLRKAFDWVSNIGCVIDDEPKHKRMKRSDTLIGLYQFSIWELN